MLTRNFPQRPTAEDLLEYPYVAQCMELLPDSSRQKASSNEKAVMKRRGSVMSPTSDCPKTADPKRIGIWLKENSQTTQTAHALDNLYNLALKSKRITNEVRKTIV